MPSPDIQPGPDGVVPTSLPPASDLRVLAVLNRYSSNYPRALRQFNLLQDLGFAASDDFVETGPSHYETSSALADKLTSGPEPYHAVITLTGDGGSNTVGQSLYWNDDTRLQSFPVIFGRGGGACDLHAMTQVPTTGKRIGKGRHYLQNLPGQQVHPLHPLIIETSSPDESISRTEAAFAHLCVGTLGRIALDVNGEPHRGSRLLGKRYAHELQEVMTGIGSVSRSRRFHLSDQGLTDWKLATDIIITNGNQMGRQKIFPGDLLEPGYQQVSTGNYGQLALAAVKLFTRNPKVMVQRTESTFYISPKGSNDTIMVSYDGETYELPLRSEPMRKAAGYVTRMQVSTSERPLHVASVH